jgi:hypothetical protein
VRINAVILSLKINSTTRSTTQAWKKVTVASGHSARIKAKERYPDIAAMAAQKMTSPFSGSSEPSPFENPAEARNRGFTQQRKMKTNVSIMFTGYLRV